MIRIVIIAPALATRAGLRAIVGAAPEFEISSEAARLEDLAGPALAADVLLIQPGADEPLEFPPGIWETDNPPAVLLVSAASAQIETLLGLPTRARGLLPEDCQG